MEPRSRDKLDELMKRYFISFLFMLDVTLSSGQDSSWVKKTLDENLSIAFPGATTVVDTAIMKNGEEFRFRAFKYQDEFSQLAVIITPNETKINADNPESLKEALAGAARGAENTLRLNNIYCSTIDTVVGNFRSKKMSCRAINGTRVISFIFLVNDKMYLLQSAFTGADEERDRKTLDPFINSAHFTKTAVKEEKFKSKSESKAFKIGEIIGIILVVVLMIALVMYLVRKK